jgi:hypothetical protein
MAKFSGKIGVRLEAKEVEPGIFEQEIRELKVVGSMDARPLRWSAGELNQDKVRANHVLSIVAPEETLPTLMNVVYVIWNNRKWTVSDIMYERPSLKMTLGGFYNG